MPDIPIPMGDDPFALFDAWFAEAQGSEINDANAMALATVGTDGQPSLRMVLLKGHDPSGFVFYTNFESRKGTELLARPVAALLFHWKSLRRQVRIEGTVERVSDAEADAYFASRARVSRLGAAASDQSRPLPSRAAFQERVDALDRQYPGDTLKRPAHWSGFRLRPAIIEFWQDMPFRLHDRRVYTRAEQGWGQQALYP